jgi:hypothetical protein
MASADLAARKRGHLRIAAGPVPASAGEIAGERLR